MASIRTPAAAQTAAGRFSSDGMLVAAEQE